MIRDFHLADFLTLSNGACGTAAIFFSMDHVRAGSIGKVYAAGTFIVLALFFDVMDGRVARWRHQASVMGRELDSLADVISFGVAPACLGFAVGLTGLLDCLVLLYFVGCGISRLARYNITAERCRRKRARSRISRGRPSRPASSWCWRSWRWPGEERWTTRFPAARSASRAGTLHPLTLLYALSGSLMISKTIHIPKP
jgi:CDP-diacylglycerol--serine O-phosphatidyltransferase